MDRVLKEGKALDEELTQLAEKEITPLLLSAGAEEEEDEDEDEEEEEGETEGDEEAEVEKPSRARRKAGSERRVST